MATTIELPEYALRLAQEGSAKCGLSLPDFITEAIEFRSSYQEQAPHRPLIPNAETVAAMENARARIGEPITTEEILRLLDEPEDQ